MARRAPPGREAGETSPFHLSGNRRSGSCPAATAASPTPPAGILRGVQAGRPSLYGLRDELARVRTPVLVVAGDEDEGCLETALMLKRTIPASGLVMLPRTGHTAHLEEPDLFNATVDRFLAAVDRGAWRERDPRSRSASTTGISPAGTV